MTPPPKVRRILLCVTGLSPQIVTETVFALGVSRATKWIPDEIRLITTLRGAENARSMLLSKKPGWFHRLRQDWKLPPIAFEDSHIEIIHNAKGQPLEDIRDDEDNRDVADGIADLVRRLTQDEHTEIHASIAGGRKTMGFFVGYAMSLWGRPQDKLSHVLISNSFESRPEFFYPTPTSQMIPARIAGQPSLDTSTAKVWLGDIPFVRLRRLLPASIIGQNSGFARAVEAANMALDQVDLEIDIDASAIWINGQAIHLPPMQFSLLSLLAWRCQQQCPPLPAPLKETDDPEWRADVMRQLNQVLGEMNIPDSLGEKLRKETPMDSTLSQQLSKLKRTLQQSGVLPLRSLIVRKNISNRNRQQGYSLDLQPERVRFVKRGKLANRTGGD